ncbi:MAG: antibiotic biosynthesis monooxygenase [Anaerolineaceae bacterium]|nr:antibiotic biosynthesis monooxygenase [Anaerolineaceae bacterium]
MIVVNVYIHIKNEFVNEFIAATLENVAGSNQEPGVARFEFHQMVEDPTRFLLMEVYKDQDAAVAHKQTAHYLAWRDTVVDMMAEDRQGVKFNLLAPEDVIWR